MQSSIPQNGIKYKFQNSIKGHLPRNFSKLFKKQRIPENGHIPEFLYSNPKIPHSELQVA